MNVIRADKPYTRKDVGEDHKNMYIFTDNTDRDRGSQGDWSAVRYNQKTDTLPHLSTGSKPNIRAFNSKGIILS